MDIRILESFWFSIKILNWSLYSVMQSDGNSFYGDVVLLIFNRAFRDKDSILEQNYEKQIFWDLYYEDFDFKIV